MVEPIGSLLNLQLDRDGAALMPGAASAILPELAAAIAQLPRDRAGVRIPDPARWLPTLAADGAIGEIAAATIPDGARPVRAILFDKSARSNWSLGWHQDRTIAVKQRRAVPGFSRWTVKHGVNHVAPPIALLSAILTLRIHIDDVPADNAPLLIAPGSHRLGVVAEADIPAVVAECGTHECLAAAGDVWLYATPILHASRASTTVGHRRVLQVDYAGFDLPGGLDWADA